MPDPRDVNFDALNHSFEALSHPYRRRILTRLHERNPREEAEFHEVTRGGDDDPDRLAVELHHRHLPKLVDAGFVDWDREEDVVTRGPRFEEIAPLVELMVDHRDELPAGWP